MNEVIGNPATMGDLHSLPSDRIVDDSLTIEAMILMVYSVP